MFMCTFLFNNSFLRPNGSLLEVPIEDVNTNIPSIGDIVTYSFDHQRRRNIPVGPKIERIRTDLLWDDVVSNYHQETLFTNNGTIHIYMALFF